MFVCSSDGVKIRVFDNKAQNPDFVVQFLHGFGEHIGRYSELAGLFGKNNAAFVIHDQRGHGKTGRAACDYEKFIDDALQIRQLIDELYPCKPVMVYGHSMGGNITANLLLSLNSKAKSDAGSICDGDKPEFEFDNENSGAIEEDEKYPYFCAVIGSPWLKLQKPLNDGTALITKVLGRLSTRITIRNTIGVEFLSHDERRIRSAKTDRLYHNNISLELFSQICERGKQAIERAGEIKIPVLTLCAGRDVLVSSHAAKKFAENGGFSLKTYPEQYHELHNEQIREQVFSDVLEFIKSNLPDS